ncbi:MAG: zeta toxin family protein [Candidatus Saccharimonadales bacterium]
MILIRDLSDEQFEEYSFTKQKLYISKLVINASKAEPVKDSTPPLAIVMAGLPGAGKTEFLDWWEDSLLKNKLNRLVRIDLDIIVTVFPGYTPKTYAKFRSQANNVLARCVDVAKDGNYNMMIDGTFGGDSGASLKNIERLLDANYLVTMFFMHDNPLTSWSYTKDREVETDRGIDKESFLQVCKNLPNNLLLVNKLYGGNKNFNMKVVLQKKLRSKEYKIIEDTEEIDDIIKKGYNIDKLKELL